MGVKEHNHFIPQMYLRHFAHSRPNSDADWIFMYDKETDCTKEIGIEDAAAKKRLYTDKTQTNPAIWEDELAKHEAVISPIIRRLIDTCRQSLIRNGATVLDSTMKQKLAGYLYLQMIRVPSSMSVIESYSEQVIPGLLDKVKREIEPIIPENKKQELSAFQMSAEDKRSIRLSHIANSPESQMIVNALCSKHWTLYRSDKRFITSDRPVVIADTQWNVHQILADGIQPPYIVICFPLSPYLLLLVSGSKIYSRFADQLFILDQHDDFVDKVNHLQYENCERFLYG